MPAVEQIVNGLERIANSWKFLAVFWHVYFGVFALVLAVGFRPGKRLASLLMAPPLLSVSIMAWMAGNPFNGIIFGALAVLMFYFCAGLPGEPARIVPSWSLFPGLALFAFGWAYPHFLAADSFFSYLYLAPTGLIPCPTLAIVIGLVLILDGLGSRVLGVILGAAGLFYGIIGVVRLGVSADWTLLLGAAIILSLAVLRIRGKVRPVLKNPVGKG